MVALAWDVGKPGEVDAQVCELPQLCWRPRRGVRGQQTPRHQQQKWAAIHTEDAEQEMEASAKTLEAPLKALLAQDLLLHGVTLALCSPSRVGRTMRCIILPSLSQT